MAIPHSNTEHFPPDSFATDLIELLEQGCRQMRIELTSSGRDQLLGHINLLAHWNKKLNLTAIVSPREMVIHHLLDSLAVNHLIRGQRLLDIGSGGGFPGMPLAILNPHLQVGLLDSRGKRIEFLRHTSGILGINNIQLIKSRVEDYRPEEKFDTLVSRAFSSLNDMLKLTSGLHKPGTRLLAMKGKEPLEEIAQLPEKWRTKVETVVLGLPFGQAERHAIIINF